MEKLMPQEIPKADGGSTSRKRKTIQNSSSNVPNKKARTPKAKGNLKEKAQIEKPEWPSYFESVSKIFNALNTVLAFCSSRKHLAITFPVVRSSVESLLKQPLELSKVAELKALLPDLVKFAYIPSIELRIHEATQNANKSKEVDFSIPGPLTQGALNMTEDEEEHVLILDFVDGSKGKKTTNPGFLYAPPPALTPAATKKLIEKRNSRFEEAVNELLSATSAEGDPVEMLQAAARDHIPINPNKSKGKGKQRAEQIVPDPEHRPAIDDVITEIQEEDWYAEQIIHRETFDAKSGANASLDPPLSESIQQALKDARKITSLYTHQVAAINALSQNKNVIVSTSTASGKSVIYQVPLLRFLEEDLDATAIFVYPTKALAQDQKAALEQLLFSCPGLEHVKVATYDGDTAQEDRRTVRETASIIFTNFDMIHASILPHEDLWRRFLKNLKLMAVDELHYYSAMFGSHVAQVLRRFRRVCAAVGNRHVKFVSCSATISKPAVHMKNLFGVDDVIEIVEDGAPSGRKDFLVWTPPFVDAMDPSLGRKSALSEATRLMRFLMARGVRVIMFCKIRKSCELAMKTLRAELTADGRLDILDRVMAYRGGYSPQDRRRIEKEAFYGNLLGIVATNALELGVDIGILDAVIMLGFPIGGIASFRQQAGRAGRRARDALAVYVADGLPVDQHFIAHPEDLFNKPMNDLMLDLDSKIIIEAHVQCAAHEAPLNLEDERYFGPLTKEICETRLQRDKEGWYHTHPKYLPYPAKYISLRGAEEERYVVVDVTRVGKPGGHPRILEEIEISRALFEIYEGAVFIHQGLTFLVQEVSHDSKTARLVRSDVNWTTEPRDFTDVNAVQTFRIKEIRNSPHRAFYGRIEIKTIVFGYFKVRNKQIIDTVDLDTPPWEQESTGMWLDVPKPTLDLMKENGINAAEAIHAASHALMNRFALSADLGTECKAAEKEYKAVESQRKRPARLIFYERGGQSGAVVAKAFDHVYDLLSQAADTVDACECESGCAACVISPACKENNLVSNKAGALLVLQALLARPISMDLMEQAIDVHDGHDTIIEATQVRLAQGVELETDSISC
ncbi:P-loop containing nucleoside triphosphate hydrolase protein [Abortiporus biennis]|nr:P-loop containing nucleoside triphosphate hydrolase protein [Abortiporus biennis]